MAAIEEIPGINGATLDLFRAAGILNSEEMVALSSEELMDRLDEANAEGEMLARLPAAAAVKAWRSAARVFEGGRGGERATLSSDVMKDVRAPGLPTARQMSSAQLREAGIPASQVSIGKLLVEVSAEMDAEEEAKAAEASAGSGPVGEVKKIEVKKAEGRREKPASKVKEETAGLEPDPEIQPARNGGAERPAIDRSNLRQIVPGREHVERDGFEPMAESQPAQRRVEKRNHGMLHRDPARVYLGALATLVAMVLGGLGFVAVGVALVYALYYEVPIPKPMLWVLPAFPVALFLHVTLGLRPRCRLCGQQLFRPKSCNKHVKSHRSPFGHIFAVALHAVTRSWFRCMLCGTKQRLRE